MIPQRMFFFLFISFIYADHLLNKLLVLGDRIAYRLGVPPTVGVIRIRGGDPILGHGGQLPAILPGEGHAIQVGEGVANLVIGDGLPIIHRQQIYPHRIAVGVGVSRPTYIRRQNVAVCIVGVGVVHPVHGGGGELILAYPGGGEQPLPPGCFSMYEQAIAFGHPNTDLSGIFLKPLRAWDYPNKLPFVPKRRCLLVYYYSFKFR